MAKKKKKKDKKKKEKTIVSGNIIEHLRAIHSLYDQQVEEAFATYDLSQEQLRILQIVKDSPEDGLSLRQIREALPNQTSNATRLVEKLRLKKLVNKKAAKADKRELRISLTPSGTEALDQANSKILEINKSINTRLKNKDLAVLMPIMDKLTDSLK